MSSIRVARAVLACACLLSFAASQSLAASLTAEEVIARHLESLGTPQARAAAKSRVVEGNAHFKTLVGGVGLLDGTAAIVSEDRKLQFMMKFANNQYGGERFIFNGDRAQIFANTGGQARSSFGDFVYNQDAVLREGLLGGALTSGWPLLNLESRKAKVSYEGLKSVDGVSVHELRYRPKKGTDVEIRLYFDAETFRHVMTVYTLSVKAELQHRERGINDVARPVAAGASTPAQEISDTSETLNARQQQTRYRIEERFSNFSQVDGLTLPSRYNLHFTQELGNGSTTAFEWDIISTGIHNNVNLDPRNFQIK